MKKLILSAILGCAFCSLQAQISVISTDTIVEGNQTTIVRKFSNGVEQRIINGATEEQLAAQGIRVGTGLKAGETMPDFAFSDLNGKPVSLGSLRGKYVYIDVWATWCNPCKQEIPYLEKLQEALGNRMHFVSISMDRMREPWEKMAGELKGTQLWFGETGDFIDRFNIRFIPRFIILDPQGVVVNPQAFRPSNPDALEILQNLTSGAYTPEQQLEYTTKGLPPKDVRGQQSPSFDYPDARGNRVKLEDFRGKYVLIDIWATWCGPCMQEIPALGELEEKMHGRNLAIVSISVDEDREAWLRMLADKQMGGTQLHFDGDRSFMDTYRLNGIPRFILLDRQGRIIDDNMQIRPSNPAIYTLLESLEGL